MTFRVALVGGPMYDELYESMSALDLEVVVHADHPTLNRRVADMLSNGEQLDLISTHSKYAPSQAQWLHPLDGLITPRELKELAPLAVDLCRYGGALLCAPRLIDVRIMWSAVADVPTTWAELAASDVVFGFPGRESGLFGTFFELVVGDGGRLFADDGRPCMDSPEAVAAVELLCRLAARSPADLPDWHYDQVDAALLDGRIDAAGVWPGGWGPISRSRAADRLTPHPYPAGSSRWVSYAGCHAWAIPITCADVRRSVEVLTMLTSAECNAVDAAGGSVCAHTATFEDVEATSDVDFDRLEITSRTIEQAMITYPPHPRFPEVEDAGWRAINEALRGLRTPADAVAEIQRQAVAILDG
jgi:multiple sugar transport system substrate-binding protein